MTHLFVRKRPRGVRRGSLRRPLALASAGLLLALGAADSLAGQATGQIRGRVVNATTAEPLVGAQVVVEGTGVGTVTNNRGQFLLLNVPAGTHTVEARSIGFGTESERVTLAAGGSASVDFRLRSEAISLEGVVVTGTPGQARRREVGNSISQINEEQIQNAAIADMGDVLQGRAAGIQISDNTGQVGAASSIRLRGNNSVRMSNAPLIYVDGVRIENDVTGSDAEMRASPHALDMINPNDIARIEVVKGPAATTLYGTEAAGGVIQIFTKRGAGGAPVWNFSMDQGITDMPHVGPDEDVNPTGLNLNDCSHEPGCPESGSWFRNGHIQRYNLSVRGGSENTNYFASGRWGRTEGVVDPQGLEEYNIRANVAFRPTQNLEISFNNMYSRRDIRWIPDGDNADGFLLNVLRGERGYTPGNDDSLVLGIDLSQEINHYITGLQTTWTPFPSLTHRVNLGLDYESTDIVDFKPWGYFAAPTGDRETDQLQDRNLTADYAGTWSAAFGEALSSSFSWGAQVFEEYDYQLNGFDERFAGPGDQLVGDGTLQSVTEDRIRIRSGGFFLQEMVGWRDRLFLTAGARWDGFSTFGEDFGLAFYPKLSAAYTISDESFFPESLGMMKLRAAWGASGKAPGTFDAARTYEATSADEQQPAVVIENLGNPELGPERTEEIELGFEGSLLDNRISYDVTYYDQTTTDALICIDRAPSLGVEECTLSNLGRVDNWGLEASLNLGLVRLESFEWEVGARYSGNQNEIVDLGGLQNLGDSYQVGLPLPANFNERVQNPDAVGELPILEKEYIGPVYPTDIYSLNTRFTLFRNLSLDLLGEAQTGHFLQAGTAYQNMRRGVWPTCTAIQEQIESGNTANLRAADRARCDPDRSDYGVWTDPADFFKLRSATLGFRVPERLLRGVRSAEIRLQARNLFTITEYEGLDPETTDDNGNQEEALFRDEYYNLPPARSFVFNVNVSF